MATFVWNPAGVSHDWQVGGNWRVGGVAQAAPPTSTDDVVFDGTSGSDCNLTSGTGTCASLVMNGYNGVFTQSVTLEVGNSSFHGAVSAYTLGSGATYAITGRTKFIADNSNVTAALITTRGNTLGAITITGAPWKLADALTCDVIEMTAGDFDTNGMTVSCYYFDAFLNSSKTITFGNSTITVAGATGYISIAGANTTLSAASATFVFAASASARSLYLGAGLGTNSVGMVTYTAASAGRLLLDSTMTIGTLNVSGAVKTLRGTAGITVTVTTFNVFGTAGNLVTIESATGGSPWTLSKASGTVNKSYLSITDSTASGGAGWYTPNSTDGGGNTGWIFGAPPSPSFPNRSPVQARRHLIVR